MTSTDVQNSREILGLLWLRPEPESGATALTRRALAEVLIRLADAEGLDAVTIERVRAELGDARSDLDHHVHYETDLADLMLDTLYAGISLPADATGDWRADLRGLAWQTWEVLKKHPWLAVLVATRPLFTPHTLAYLNFSFAALEGRGLDRKTIAMVAGQVTNLGIGPMLVLLADEASKKKLFAQAPPADVDIHAVIAGFIRSVADSGRYPALGAFLLEGSPHAGPDESFEFALESLLDGIARRLDDRAR
jgi:hypothetical protein